MRGSKSEQSLKIKRIVFCHRSYLNIFFIVSLFGIIGLFSCLKQSKSSLAFNADLQAADLIAFAPIHALESKEKKESSVVGVSFIKDKSSVDTLKKDNNNQRFVVILEIERFLNRGFYIVQNLLDKAIKNVIVDREWFYSDKTSKKRNKITEKSEPRISEEKNYKHIPDFWRQCSGLLMIFFTILCCQFLIIFKLRSEKHLLKKYQKFLFLENIILEKRASERESELDEERKFAEKERKRAELFLQESTHRIGNSLATVSSLLGLQLSKSSHPEVRFALAAARDRIQLISTAHRRLRLKEDQDLAAVDGFLLSVIADIRTTLTPSAHKINFSTKVAPYELASRDVTTLGIILGELITNVCKHAFPNEKKGTVQIFLGYRKKKFILCVEDNGIGFKKQIRDTHEKKSEGLGLKVIERLCLQVGSAPIFEDLMLERGQGTRVTIHLSKLEKNLYDQEKTYGHANEFGCSE